MSLMQYRMVMAMKAYPVLCNNIIAVTDKGMTVLQNWLDSQKNLPGLHSETCASSSLSGVQAVDIKAEEISDIEDTKDHVPMTIVGIKAEHEVSCMFPLYPLLKTYLSHIQKCLFSFSYSSFTQNFSSTVFYHPVAYN
jgi:hypothetical protein